MKSDFILNLINKITAAVLKITLYGIAARLIGVEEFGIFILLLSVFTVVSQIIIFGSEYSILNAQYKLEFSLILTYTIFKSIVVITLFYLLGLLILDEFEALAIALFVGSQILFLMMHTIYIKYNKYLSFVMVNLLVNIIPIILILILPVKDAHYVLIAIAIPKVLFMILAMFSVKSFNIKNLYQIKNIYKSSLKFVVFEQLKFIHHRFDIILLSIFNLNYIAGLLGAIKNFVEFSQYIPNTIQIIIYKYKQNVSTIIKYSYTFLTIFFSVLLLMLLFFGDLIIGLIFGSEFIVITEGLLLSMIGAYFYSLGYINMSILIGNFNRINRLSIIVSLIFAFNYTIFIVCFEEFLGAILGFMISSFIYFIISLLTIINYQRKI